MDSKDDIDFRACLGPRRQVAPAGSSCRSRRIGRIAGCLVARNYHSNLAALGAFKVFLVELVAGLF